MNIIYFLLARLFFSQMEVPLGCIEDENSIIMNWPFYSIPLGKRNEISNQCGYKPNLDKAIIENSISINNAIVDKKKDQIRLKKGRSNIKKFYSTLDLSPFPGIFLSELSLRKENEIGIYLAKIDGDGLFLLVLRRDDTLFMRQIIIDQSTKCPVKVSLSIKDFIEIPFYKGGFVEGLYRIELYMVNYNSMEWTLLGFEVK
ncbi:MAG: hypothetical protein N2746_03705 [Deltaproteobacteria bacterium]|nr:hypothetical protein [Deltaproteobacteria bacterium]